MTGVRLNATLRDLPKRRDAAFAGRVLENLLARGIFARKPSVPPLDRCIRISCGLDKDLDVLALHLPGALDAAS